MALNNDIWQGSSSFFPGDTPHGYYDKDSEFQVDIVNSTTWAAGKLGYPLMDIELTKEQFYGCFEEAVTEYSAQVNYMNIKNNMFNMMGESTGTNLTHKYVKGGVLNTITVGRDYGTIIGARGDKKLNLTSIPTTQSVQRYDLENYGVSSSADIVNVFHWEAPASLRFYDPFYGSGLINMIRDFGINASSYTSPELLFPHNLETLRIQSVEISDMIYRSERSFRIVGNEMIVFPIPSSTSHSIWVEWFDISSTDKVSDTPLVSDFSNMRYDNMVYADINHPGKQWIKRYFLSLCKEVLGLVRSKYASVPIPEAEINLDGDTLRSEAQAEQQDLIQQLRDDLQSMSKEEVYRREAEAANSLSEMNKHVPFRTPFMWG